MFFHGARTQEASSPQPTARLTWAGQESRPAAARWRPFGIADAAAETQREPGSPRQRQARQHRRPQRSPAPRPGNAGPSPAASRQPSPAPRRTRRGPRKLTSGRGRWRGTRRAVPSRPRPQFAQGPRALRAPRPPAWSSSEPEHRSSQTPPGSRAAPRGPSPPPSVTAAGRAPWPALRRPESARGGGAGGGGRVWPPSYQLHGGHQLPAAGLAASATSPLRGRSRELGVGSPENPASPSRCTSSALD